MRDFTSKNSWLFKLHCEMSSEFTSKYKYHNQSIGACAYFWMSVFMLFIKLPVIICIIAGLSALALVCVFGIFIPIFTSSVSEPLDVAFVISFYTWLGVTISLAISGLIKITDRIKKPTLISSYLNARKTKFCPQFKFKD